MNTGRSTYRPHSATGRSPSPFGGAELRRPDLWAFVAVLLFSLMVGGGGSPAVMSELAVQCFALCAFALLAATSHYRSYLPHRVFARDRALGGCWLALIVLYLLQLVPLPPGLWALLPGREAIAMNAQLFDQAPWLPLSIAPSLTFASLLSLIPPLIAYAIATGVSRDGRQWLFPALFIFGLCTVTLQMLQTTGNIVLYEGGQAEYPNGFQANRNSQADILAYLLAALALRPRGGATAGQFAWQQAAMAAVLCFAMVLTGSRSGLGMIALILPMFALRFLPDDTAARLRMAALAIPAMAVAALGAVIAFGGNAVVQRTLDRFMIDGDARFDIVWPDAIYAARALFPWGAGFGTFVPAFQIFESHETFVVKFANRAHSEPLELLMEAGLPGILIVLAGAALILMRAVTGIIHAGDEGERSRASLLLVMALLICLHSLGDYPLRSMSIAVFLAAVLGLVVADRVDRKRVAKNSA
jgi:O-antigen ligase